MNGIKILAIVLIAAGILGLAYGGFSYRGETHKGSLGPMEFSMTETKTVNIPLWAGVGAIALGGVLLFAPVKRLWGH
jgi:hypothetical protein